MQSTVRRQGPMAGNKPEIGSHRWLYRCACSFRVLDTLCDKSICPRLAERNVQQSAPDRRLKGVLNNASGTLAPGSNTFSQTPLLLIIGECAQKVSPSNKTPPLRRDLFSGLLLPGLFALINEAERANRDRRTETPRPKRWVLSDGQPNVFSARPGLSGVSASCAINRSCSRDGRKGRLQGFKHARTRTQCSPVSPCASADILLGCPARPNGKSR